MCTSRTRRCTKATTAETRSTAFRSSGARPVGRSLAGVAQADVPARLIRVRVGLPVGDLPIADLDHPAGGDVEVHAALDAAGLPPARDEELVADALEALGVDLELLPRDEDLVVPPAQDRLGAAVGPALERGPERDRNDFRMEIPPERALIAAGEGRPDAANHLDVLVGQRLHPDVGGDLVDADGGALAHALGRVHRVQRGLALAQIVLAREDADEHRPAAVGVDQEGDALALHALGRPTPLLHVGLHLLGRGAKAIRRPTLEGHYTRKRHRRSSRRVLGRTLTERLGSLHDLPDDAFL